MPPAAKGAKDAKKPTAGKDIRSWFSGAKKPAGEPTSTPMSSLGSQNYSSQSKPIVKTPVAPKASTSTQPSTPITVPTTEDDSDDEPVVRRPTNGLKRKKIVAASSSEESEGEETPAPKKVAVASSSAPRAKPKSAPKKSIQKKKKDDFVVSDDGDESAMSVVENSDNDELIPKKRPPPKKKSAATAKTPKKAPVADKTKPSGSADQKDATDKKPKFDWAAAKAAKLAGPAAQGSKAVPDGDPNALAGLCFVFTGELSAFSRDEALDLAKRFGGRVVGQPSSKTDYVIVGDNAGPSKLAALKKHGIKMLNEDEFLDLIGTRKGLGNGKPDEKTKKKTEKEQQDIVKAAKEISAREAKASTSGDRAKEVSLSSQLWTTRYAPQSLKEVCGNKTQIEKLQQWLGDWPASLKCGFKKPGKNAMNTYRAVLISGSPGIGKTTSAHLCAKLAGYTPIELNASDARSKKLVESGMNINNTSLDGFIKGAQSVNDVGVTITNKSCIIMDEVDGMSAGDRGGVGALNALIKKSKIPIICIANDKNVQKLKPLLATTFGLTFHKLIGSSIHGHVTEVLHPRPQVTAIRSRIMTIAYKEKLKIPANVVDQLITGAQSDIRQVLNMLSTWKLSKETMDFDEGKVLSKMNEKYSIMSPFDLTIKILGPYLFAMNARETLADKMELYFQDHSFVPMFIQENYLKTQPAQLRNLDGPEKELRELELMDKAASSISDGDLVDSLIHGPEQHWGLMPLHAVCSTVRPASHVYGAGVHWGGQNSIGFPQWLGQNSKQGKLSRQLGDIQIRMRLKVSGDKSEIRQSYIPALFPHLVKPLMDEGASAVDGVIERMDSYFISKEDWDTVVELGVGDHKDDTVTKKISGATKGALTRKYNSTEHPIPFHKAEDLGKAPKKLASAGPKPDVEDAFEADDIAEENSDDEKKPSNSDDPFSDKLVQSKKAKGKGKPVAKSKSKTKVE
ncbi:DNA replication factor C, large subunit [Pluteus cervinus]|uniref:DNA replication factor C, large subunit n=1 Tax=Pluteus cervinus TaxID=181527 RepID=A0ACD3B2D5_9AGAR|nr:DNA replication factor C, large subunit [Pluteus cervinus]